MFRVESRLIFFTVLLTLNPSMAEVIDGEDLIDPTRPINFVSSGGNIELPALEASPSSPNYDVTFIRVSNTSPLAVVNGERVTIGDTIGNAEIVGIDRDGIVLLINDEELRVDLYSNTIKSTVENR